MGMIESGFSMRCSALIVFVCMIITSCPADSDSETSLSNNAFSSEGLATQGASHKESGATVDDFFLDYLTAIEKFYYETNVYHKRAVDKLTKRLADDEERYGHLQEYWEFRSCFEQNDGKAAFAGRYAKEQLNRDLLAKALDIHTNSTETDPEIKADLASGAVAILNAMCAMDVADNEKKMEDLTEENSKPSDIVYSDDIEIEYLRKMIDIEPDNARHHMTLAVKLLSFGEWDNALAEFELAGKCSVYKEPSLFPIRYINENASDIEENKGVFSKINDKSKLALFTISTSAELPNFIRIKDAYKHAVVGIRMGADARSTLAPMHRAACSLSKNRQSKMIHTLVSVVLVNICAGEALSVAHATGDKDMELAALAVKNATAKMISETKWIQINAGDFNMNYIYKVTGKKPKDAQGNLMKIDEKRVPDHGGILTYENNAIDKIVIPLVEEIESLDYNDPASWYEEWFEENVENTNEKSLQ